MTTRRRRGAARLVPLALALALGSAPAALGQSEEAQRELGKLFEQINGEWDRLDKFSEDMTDTWLLDYHNGLGEIKKRADACLILYPNCYQACFYAGRNGYMLGEYQSAIDWLVKANRILRENLHSDELLKPHVKGGYIWHWTGLSHECLGQWDKAIENYRAVQAWRKRSGIGRPEEMDSEIRRCEVLKKEFDELGRWLKDNPVPEGAKAEVGMVGGGIRHHGKYTLEKKGGRFLIRHAIPILYKSDRNNWEAIRDRLPKLIKLAEGIYARSGIDLEVSLSVVQEKDVPNLDRCVVRVYDRWPPREDPSLAAMRASTPFDPEKKSRGLADCCDWPIGDIFGYPVGDAGMAEILAHEIAHHLGLHHPIRKEYEDPRNLMRGSIVWAPSIRCFSPDDVRMLVSPLTPGYEQLGEAVMSAWRLDKQGKRTEAVRALTQGLHILSPLDFLEVCSLKFAGDCLLEMGAREEADSAYRRCLLWVQSYWEDFTRFAPIAGGLFVLDMALYFQMEGDIRGLEGNPTRASQCFREARLLAPGLPANITTREILADLYLRRGHKPTIEADTPQRARDRATAKELDPQVGYARLARYLERAPMGELAVIPMWDPYVVTGEWKKPRNDGRRLIFYSYVPFDPRHAEMEALFASISKDPVARGFALIRVPAYLSREGMQVRKGIDLPVSMDLSTSDFGKGIVNPAWIVEVMRSNTSTGAYFKKVPTEAEFLNALRKVVAEDPAPAAKQSDPGIEKDTIAPALTKAKAKGQSLVVYFYEEGTPGQAAMEMFISVLERPAEEAFLVVRIPLWKNRELAGKYGCQAAPHVIVYKTDGTVCTTLKKAPTKQEWGRIAKEALGPGAAAGKP